MDFVGTGKRLTASDYAAAAAIIDVPVATIRGVVDVEAAGHGFDAANRPKILTEPHIFYKRLGAGEKRDKAVAAGIAYPRWGTKPYPPTSQGNYDRLALMIAIDANIALESTSWGLAQIMGFNFKDAGYADATAMVEAFKTGEGEQLDAFMRLVDAWDLEDDLQRRDAKSFASHYNGASYAQNGYDKKLLAAWAKHDKEAVVAPASPAVPVKLASEVEEVPTDTRAPAAAAQPPADPDAITDPTTVMSVQTQLRAKGYYGVGPIDGELTPQGMTESAILNFRNKNGLPLKPTIDKDFLAALAAAPAIEVSDDRKSMTTTEVAQASPELAPVLKTTWWQKATAAAAAAFGGLWTVGSGIVSNLGDAVDKLMPVKQFLGDVPTWGWGVIVVIVAGGLFGLAHHTGEQAKQLYNKGIVT
jgi:hypothetical protein